MEHKISEIIAEHRRALGLTQEQLGARLGISGQAVSKWEKGESMPDILLLPDLCDIFGISVDELLGHRAGNTHNTMQDFCALARREGRSKTLLEALGSLYNDTGVNRGEPKILFAPDNVRVYDRDGMGFILTDTAMQEKLRRLPEADVAYFLAPLTDETTLAVLSKTSPDYAVTEDELCAALGIDEETADRILLGLMKRNILCCDTDPFGKRGYLQSANMIGVCMILAGCAASNFGGEPSGYLWMSRSPQFMA